jgi:hypothetical protein
MLTTSLEALIVKVGRGLLMKDVKLTDPQLLESLHTECGVNTSTNDAIVQFSEGEAAVPMVWARGALADCIKKQGVVQAVVEAGASIEAENPFGYRPLHHAALFGQVSFLQAILDQKPDVTARTSLDQTALHLAALHGNIAIMPALMLAGVPKDAVDQNGKTAMDVMADSRSFKRSEWRESDKTFVLTAGNNGGWFVPSESGISLRERERTNGCDFDVVDWTGDFDKEVFLFQHVMRQRPVLVKGVLNNIEGPANYANLEKQWSRKKFETLFGEVKIKDGLIPYSGSFGGSFNHTTIGKELHRMKKVHVEDEEAWSDTKEPAGTNFPLPTRGYIFHPIQDRNRMTESIDTDFDPFNIPFLACDEFDFTNVQFYMGARGSGAPYHTHKQAYNALVYGVKRWAVQPPQDAMYSTQHPQAVFAELDAQDESARLGRASVLECTQEAGDVVFVPDGWGHATLNLAESIGWAQEFGYGPREIGDYTDLV